MSCKLKSKATFKEKKTRIIKDMKYSNPSLLLTREYFSVLS